MFVVDTNVLLYAADRHAPGHERCRTLVNDWRTREAVWHITWGIAYEFLRVATHPRVFRRPWSAAAAWEFIEAILASPGMSVLTETERHREVAGTVLRELPLIAGNLVFDAHIAILMREHGLQTIWTHDADFHRFPFLKVLDPLQ